MPIVQPDWSRPPLHPWGDDWWNTPPPTPPPAPSPATPPPGSSPITPPGGSPPAVGDDFFRQQYGVPIAPPQASPSPQVQAYLALQQMQQNNQQQAQQPPVDPQLTADQAIPVTDASDRRDQNPAPQGWPSYLPPPNAPPPQSGFDYAQQHLRQQIASRFANIGKPWTENSPPPGFPSYLPAPDPNQLSDLHGNQPGDVLSYKTNPDGSSDYVINSGAGAPTLAPRTRVIQPSPIKNLSDTLGATLGAALDTFGAAAQGVETGIGAANQKLLGGSTIHGDVPLSDGTTYHGTTDLNLGGITVPNATGTTAPSPGGTQVVDAAHQLYGDTPRVAAALQAVTQMAYSPGEAQLQAVDRMVKLGQTPEVAIYGDPTVVSANLVNKGYQDNPLAAIQSDPSSKYMYDLLKARGQTDAEIINTFNTTGLPGAQYLPTEMLGKALLDPTLVVGHVGKLFTEGLTEAKTFSWLLQPATEEEALGRLVHEFRPTGTAVDDWLPFVRTPSAVLDQTVQLGHDATSVILADAAAQAGKAGEIDGAVRPTLMPVMKALVDSAEHAPARALFESDEAYQLAQKSWEASQASAKAMLSPYTAASSAGGRVGAAILRRLMEDEAGHVSSQTILNILKNEDGTFKTAAEVLPPLMAKYSKAAESLLTPERMGAQTLTEFVAETGKPAQAYPVFERGLAGAEEKAALAKSAAAEQLAAVKAKNSALAGQLKYNLNPGDYAALGVNRIKNKVNAGLWNLFAKYNPAYTFRNGINNLTTALADGVMALDKNDEIAAFNRDILGNPLAASRGIGGGAAYGQAEDALKTLRAGMTLPERIKATAGTFAREGFTSGNLRLGAQNVERFFSERVVYKAARDFLSKMLQYGKAIPELPPGVADELGPELTRGLIQQIQHTHGDVNAAMEWLKGQTGESEIWRMMDSEHWNALDEFHGPTARKINDLNLTAETPEAYRTGMAEIRADARARLKAVDDASPALIAMSDERAEAYGADLQAAEKAGVRPDSLDPKSFEDKLKADRLSRDTAQGKAWETVKANPTKENVASLQETQAKLEQANAKTRAAHDALRQQALDDTAKWRSMAAQGSKSKKQAGAVINQIWSKYFEARDKLWTGFRDQAVNEWGGLAERLGMAHTPESGQLAATERAAQTAGAVKPPTLPATDAAALPITKDNLATQPRHLLPADVSRAMGDYANSMARQLSDGEAGFRTAMVTGEHPDAAGVNVTGGTLAVPTTNPPWYRELYDQFGSKINKKSVQAALAKIVKDSGADKGITVERVKDFIVKLLTEGDPLDGSPPEPELLRMLGRPQDEIDAATKRWADAGIEPAIKPQDNAPGVMRPTTPPQVTGNYTPLAPVEVKQIRNALSQSATSHNVIKTNAGDMNYLSLGPDSIIVAGRDGKTSELDYQLVNEVQDASGKTIWKRPGATPPEMAGAKPGGLPDTTLNAAPGGPPVTPFDQGTSFDLKPQGGPVAPDQAAPINATGTPFEAAVNRANPVPTKWTPADPRSILPVIDNIEAQTLQKWGQTKLLNIGDDTQKLLGEWGDTAHRMAMDARTLAGGVGTEARNFALLNYSDKRNLDTWLQTVMPYQYWYGRTFKNWAVRGLTNPALLAGYGRYKQALDEMHGNLPDYWKQQITTDDLGINLDTPLMFNLEQTLSPLYGLLGTDFNDPNQRRASLGPLGNMGSALMDLGGAGPSAWTPLLWATALSTFMSGDKQSAMAISDNYLGGAFKALRGATALANEAVASGGTKGPFPAGGVNLDPQMFIANLMNGARPTTGSNMFTGMTQWEANRVGKLLTDQANNPPPGKDPQDWAAEVREAAYLQSGPVWDQALQKMFADTSPWVLASYTAGLGFKGRQSYETEFNAIWNERQNIQSHIGDWSKEKISQAYLDLNRRHPNAEMVQFSQQAGPMRDDTWVWDAVGKVGIANSADWTAAGVSPKTLQAFYTLKTTQGMSDLQKKELIAGATAINSQYRPVSADEQQNQLNARKTYTQAMGALTAKYGANVMSMEQQFFQIRDQAGPTAADAWMAGQPPAEQALLKAMQEERAGALSNDPLASRYYVDPNSYRSLQITNYFAAEEVKLPGMRDLDAEYQQLRAIDPTAATALLTDNPGLRAYWNDNQHFFNVELPGTVKTWLQGLPQVEQMQLRQDVQPGSTLQQAVQSEALRQSTLYNPNSSPAIFGSSASGGGSSASGAPTGAAVGKTPVTPVQQSNIDKYLAQADATRAAAVEAQTYLKPDNRKGYIDGVLQPMADQYGPEVAARMLLAPYTDPKTGGPAAWPDSAPTSLHDLLDFVGSDKSIREALMLDAIDKKGDPNWVFYVAYLRNLPPDQLAQITKQYPQLADAAMVASAAQQHQYPSEAALNDVLGISATFTEDGRAALGKQSVSISAKDKKLIEAGKLDPSALPGLGKNGAAGNGSAGGGAGSLSAATIKRLAAGRGGGGGGGRAPAAPTAQQTADAQVTTWLGFENTMKTTQPDLLVLLKDYFDAGDYLYKEQMLRQHPELYSYLKSLGDARIMELMQAYAAFRAAAGGATTPTALASGARAKVNILRTYTQRPQAAGLPG